MADIFYTILILWILWRIFGGGIKSAVFPKQDFTPPRKKEGEVTISSTDSQSKNKDDDRGEYVDYEEVK